MLLEFWRGGWRRKCRVRCSKFRIGKLRHLIKIIMWGKLRVRDRFISLRSLARNWEVKRRNRLPRRSILK